MKVFGPVPSRRLGRSIGVNNIPPKICSLSCVYCQLGRSLKMETDRRDYYSTEELIEEVKKKIEDSRKNNEEIDYLTVVPDGEPTLDINLGKLITALNTTGIKTAVITNSTLIERLDVREELALAHWVSVKVDAVDEAVWRKVDRPVRSIDLDHMLDGILRFSEIYKGKLVTETMLVRDVNDSVESVKNTAAFISKFKPEESYLSIPTRPPAEKWCMAPEEHVINRAYQFFSDQGLNAEYLIGYEGNRFAYTGNVEEDILSITSVHPMREDAVKEYLRKAKGDFVEIERLVADGNLVVSEYNGHSFYMRKLR